jgi:hypothetical protein
VRSGVLTAVTVKRIIFWDVTSRNLVKVHQYFWGVNQAELLTACLVYSSTMKTEAVRLSETSEGL